jgi:hypothetical protein
MERIQVIGHEEVTGALKAVYDELLAKRGKLAEVHKIQCLNLATIVHHTDLYLSCCTLSPEPCPARDDGCCGIGGKQLQLLPDTPQAGPAALLER